MPKTTPELIRHVLTQGYDPSYYASIYKQMCYAFGEPWSTHRYGSGTTAKGRLLDFPDVTVKFLKIGQSRRILNAQFIRLASVMAIQPAPEFPQADQVTAEVRKQFILRRADQGEWSIEDAMAFMDGDGLGFGGVQIVLRTNPLSGYQQVAVRHIPAVHVLWDRHERNPLKARYMAFVHHLAPDVAETIYGRKAVNRYMATQIETLAAMPLETVRVIEYYDRGLGKKGVPTRAVIASDLEGEYLEEPHENPFGDMIPFAGYVHFVAPGMRRPVGRIALQMSSQEALNEVEQSMRRTLRQGAITLVDTNQIDRADEPRVLRGELDEPVRFSASGTRPAIERVPGAETSASIARWVDILERQFNTDSGQTELDQGNQLQESRTLGEVELLDQRSQTQGQWSKLQAIEYHRRKYEIVLKVAGMFDRDPLDVDVLGQTYTVNQEGNPNSWMDVWTADYSSIAINQESLQVADMRRDRAQKLLELQQLDPEVQMGLVNPAWRTEEKLKALGYDPKEAMPDPQQQAQQQMARQVPVETPAPALPKQNSASTRK